MRGSVFIARAASIAVASLLVMHAAGCNKLGKAPDISCAEGKCPEIEPMEATTLVVQSKDAFLSRVRMSLSPASITSAVAIHIQQAREPIDYTVVTKHRALPIGKTVKFSPQGLTFLHDPLVEIPFDPSRLAKAPANARIRVALGAGDGKDVEWIEPEKIDREKGIVSFRIPHFSDAAVVADEPGAPGGPLVPPAPEPINTGGGPCAPWMDEMIAVVKCGEDGKGGGGSGGGGGGRFGPGVADDCPATYDEGVFWKDISLNGFVEAGYRVGRLGMYLYIEDGGVMPTLLKDFGVRPLRTNQEVELYNLIKGHVRQNPGKPLTQADVMGLALEASRDRDDDNKCFKSVLTATMTAHNVMRLLARPEQWAPHLLNANGRLCTTPAELDACNRMDAGAWGHNVDDAALPMLMDLANSTSTDGNPTLPQLLQSQKRVQIKEGRADFGWMGGLFGDAKVFTEPPGLDVPCQGLKRPSDIKQCRDSHAGGCAYYHWTGAMGMGGLGELLAGYGFNKESSVKNALGQAERGSYEVACAKKGGEVLRCLKSVMDGTIPFDCDKRKKSELKPSGPKPNPKPAPPAPPPPGPQCQPACNPPRTCSNGTCYCPQCPPNHTLDLASCYCKRRGSY